VCAWTAFKIFLWTDSIGVSKGELYG
jgi:hypothetical protein